MGTKSGICCNSGLVLKLSCAFFCSAYIRKRKEWYLYEPVVDVVPKEEAAVVDAKEQLK